ncbi:MAG: cytochrome c [Flavobacteriales bacterium]|nr:cytochrome c [Flavobacteriales bacterium]
MGLRTKRGIFWTLILLFAGYSVMVYDQGTAHSTGEEAYTAAADRGKMVYHQYNCVSCHQIYGLGGYMGPDLTNVTTSKGRAYAEAFITGGTAKMPRLGLDRQETDDLLDYLEYVGKAGHYPVTDLETTFYGNIIPADGK